MDRIYRMTSCFLPPFRSCREAPIKQPTSSIWAAMLKIRCWITAQKKSSLLSFVFWKSFAQEIRIQQYYSFLTTDVSDC